jgi:hypothetical protein
MSRPIAIIVPVLMDVACCYHVRGVCVIVAVPMTFLLGAVVKLVFRVDISSLIVSGFWVLRSNLLHQPTRLPSS